ncbi:MAG: serpin family protein [Armatimonadetes bacterium]|nr:serpin family protein [Armatimonadota bacterium]
MRSACYLGAMLIVVLSGCAGHSSRHAQQKSETLASFYEKLPKWKASDKAILRSHRAFAQNFLRATLAHHPKDNLVFSPSSIVECLTMLRLGSSGECNQVLEKILSQVSDAEICSKSYQVRGHNFVSFEPVLQRANGIWTTQAIEPSYVRSIQSLYSARATSTHFPKPALREINTFVKENTQGVIPTIVTEEDLTEDTDMVLVNTLHFLDEWAQEFALNATSRREFLTGKRKKVMVQMMRKSEANVSYFENTLYQSIRLPYRSGIEMAVLLPKRGKTIDELVNKGEILNFPTKTFSYRTGNVQLPKWRHEYTTDIRSYLTARGGKKLFAFSRDWPKFGRDAFKVTKVLHCAKIAVDERKTEAAAATAVVAEEWKAVDESPEKPFQFIADHPFLYMILAPDGDPLFVGVLNDPTQQ